MQTTPHQTEEKMSHTPGPWRVNEQYSPDHQAPRPTPYILDTQGRYVAAALTGDPSITDEEHAANARLVAAAPELLEALKLCQVKIFMLNGSENEAYEQARQAIAKTEGTEQR